MQITPHQAKYFAYELTKRSPSNSVDKLVATLADAQVDLNPHQIDAALFAFRSPLSKGAILADEVGLGKTIEAGILLSQKWAERKRRLLVIAPATLRKQWNQELADKFFLPSFILEKRSFDDQIKAGNLNPFDQATILICSYHFARSKEAYLKQVPWDLVIIDEAHRLRNVYKPANRIANTIKTALAHAPKILLTATPLQNSLLELFGLVSIVDEYVFGDIKSFKDQFSNLKTDEDFQSLRARLKSTCQRTLRRQVLEYIRYTNRIPITQEFVPNDDEQKLYDLVSEYLQRENLYALPAGQRKLITLILRKLLASSTYAISRTLDALASRLDAIQTAQGRFNQNIDIQETTPDLESAQELEEEWDEDEKEDATVETEMLSPDQLDELSEECRLVKEFQQLAHSITKNSKGEVLLTALKEGFEKLRELGAAQKAVIFTESTRTQEYLRNILNSSPEYAGRVVLFNGSNSDEKSKIIYKQWLGKHHGTDRVTGSPSSDMRAALVDYFREEAIILIATEAAAEGINLQFCSLVVNYDLPWNPQRIEQRIGRCHRYGQKYDVVVVNFLNKNNAADQRVYELLSEKFQLFNGVFGASDEVLGVIESGVDFEKRISEIYQRCRTPQQIEYEFNELKKELEEQVNTRLSDTKNKLLENFDEEVQEKLRIGKAKAEEALSKHEAWLWQITRFFLRDDAEFHDDKNSFVLKNNPFPNEVIHPGPYRSGKNVQDVNLFRVGHPLAQKIIEACKALESSPASIEFNLSDSGRKITALEPYIGQEGYLEVCQLSLLALDNEEYLVLAAKTMSGEVLEEEVIARMLTLPANILDQILQSENIELKNILNQKISEISAENESRNASFFEDELDKLDFWAEDQRTSLRVNIRDLEVEIKETKKMARLAGNLPEKIKLEKHRRTLESKRDDLWRQYDVEAKRIEQKKDELIDNIEAQLQAKAKQNTLFKIKWKII